MSSPGGLRSVMLIVSVGLVLGLAFQGSRGLYETTEGRYAEVAREMLEEGSWLRPTLDHEPHWTKPPLAYWAIAGGLALVGRNAWGVRLANALALPVTALGVACLGWLLWGAAEGRLAGLVYASALFPVVAASTVSTDLLLSMWEVWAVAAWWAAARAGSEPRRARFLIAFWALLGLAFLTKGPPGLLPLLPIAVWSLLARRRGDARFHVWSAAGLVAFAVIGLSWYLWAVLTTPGLLGYFLGEEVVARVATDHFGRNPEWWMPPLVYGPPLALGLGAWLAWRPRRALRTFLDELRPPGGDEAEPTRRPGASASPLRFLVLWLVLPLLVLSLSRSRLPLYVLPLFPAIALAFARAQVRLGGTRGWIGDPAGRWLTANLVLVLLLKAGSTVIPSPKNMTPLATRIRQADPARVVLVDTRLLYGLQFYLDAPVERIDARHASDLVFHRRPAVLTGREAAPGPTVVVARTDSALPSPGELSAHGCAARTLSLVPGYVGARVRCPHGQAVPAHRGGTGAVYSPGP